MTLIAAVLLTIKLLICIGIALRVFLYRKGESTHRPIAAALAYLLMVAAANEAIDAAWYLWVGRGEATLSEVFLLCLLLCALIAARGNVLALFWTGDESRLYRWIKNGGCRHAKG